MNTLNPPSRVGWRPAPTAESRLVIAAGMSPQTKATGDLSQVASDVKAYG